MFSYNMTSFEQKRRQFVNFYKYLMRKVEIMKINSFEKVRDDLAAKYCEFIN